MPIIYKTSVINAGYSAAGQLSITKKQEIDWRTMALNCERKGLIKIRKTDHQYDEYNINIIECNGRKCNMSLEAITVEGNGPEYTRMKHFIINNC